MNNPLPLISVLIPAYNHERYITRCLDSVLEDPYPNKEIIVIDDGSKDATYARIQEWAAAHKERINVVMRSRPNKGTAKTINEAWFAAHGEYVALLASDDYLLAGGLEKRSVYLDAHPELLAVVGDCITVDGDDKIVSQSTLRDFHHSDPELYSTPNKVAFQIVWRWALPGSILMARRSTYDVIGSYDEARKIEDWDFFLRLAARQALGFVNTPITAYRWHATNSCAGADRQAFILKELSMSGLKRVVCFRNPVLAGIVLAKAIYYGLKSVVYAWRNKFALSK